MFFFPLQVETTWAQRLEEARHEKHRQTTEASCQTDENSNLTITAQELDSRLSAQKQQLQLEADKVKRKAVEEARKQVQRELHDKHLEAMTEQASGLSLLPCAGHQFDYCNLVFVCMGNLKTC